MTRDHLQNMRTYDAYKNRRKIASFLVELAIIIALVFTIHTLSETRTESDQLRVEMVQNLAISPDAADYMHKKGHGLIFDDMSVE